MRFGKNFLVRAALLCGSVFLAFGHGQITGQQLEQKLSVGVAEVAVDVVVRDKQGKPVKGLTTYDFEVYEEGVPQQITSARLVLVGPAQQNATAPKSGVSGPTNLTGTLEAPRITAVAFVFDRLSPEGRPHAREAALSYVGENMKLDTYVGVYVIDHSLQVLQPLSRDVKLVRSAIERAGEHASTISSFSESDITNVRSELNSLMRAQSPGAQPADPFGRAMLESQLRLLESFADLQAEQQGRAAINGLTAVIDSLQGIAGRKAVFLFSEGFPLPPNVEPVFRSMIGAASSSHVSVFAIDAAGLRTGSAQFAVSQDIQSRSNARMNQLDTGTDDSLGPMTKDLERNEATLRSDPRAGLGMLSKQTGGFLISDTNDLKTGLKRIDDDLRTFYMLTYTPKNQTADGRFRRIEVKVKRSGLSVQGRKGYYALNGVYSSPVMEYETRALAIAGAGRRPDILKVKSRALSFPESSRAGLLTVLASTPMRDITFQTDGQNKALRSDFSIVVLIKSATEQVVRKLSHRYLVGEPPDDIEGARKEDVLFYRETDLDPGLYRVQTVVYDALGRKAGAQEDTVEVSSAGETGLRLSSIVIIKRAERLKAAEQKTSNPFRVGELLVYPNMGEPIQKATHKQLPFFFNVYVPKGMTAKPNLVIELLQQGRALAQMPAELPLADETGRIQYMGGLPLETLPAGEYEMKVTIKNGTANVTRSVRFALKM